MMARRWPIGPLLAVALLLALTASACSAATIEWGDEPLDWEWPIQAFITADRLAEWSADHHESVIDERHWCRANAGLLPRGAAFSLFGEDAHPDDVERFFDPVGPAELDWIGDLAELTAAGRELPLDPMPPIRVISHDNLRVVACHALLHEDQIGDSDNLWLFERALGINHPDWTPAILGALATYSYGGWYATETATITLIGDTPLERYTFGTVSHEIVHALQDQSLDGGLKAVYEDVTDDHGQAISWIVEGDAVTATIDEASAMGRELAGDYEWSSGGVWVAERNGLSLGLAPLRGQQFFSRYQSGADYVRGQQQEGGWQRIDELLADPPDSSEQILHPEKLASREPPIDAALLADLRRKVFDPSEEPDTTTMGELYLSKFVALSTQDAERGSIAAAGWGGDQLAVWSTVDRRRVTVAIWLIAFDDAAEHREGHEGLREWLLAWSGYSAVGDRTGRAIAYDGPAGAIRLVDSSRAVWLIVSDDVSTADRITLNALSLSESPDWWSSGPG